MAATDWPEPGTAWPPSWAVPAVVGGRSSAESPAPVGSQRPRAVAAAACPLSSGALDRRATAASRSHGASPLEAWASSTAACREGPTPSLSRGWAPGARESHAAPAGHHREAPGPIVGLPRDRASRAGRSVWRARPAQICRGTRRGATAARPAAAPGRAWPSAALLSRSVAPRHVSAPGRETLAAWRGGLPAARAGRGSRRRPWARTAGRRRCPRARSRGPTRAR